MDEQEAHSAGAENRVGRARGFAAGLEGQGQRRLEREEAKPSEGRHRVRALQEGLSLNLPEDQAALPAEKKEEQCSRHELGVELANRFAQRQDAGITTVP